MNEHIRFSESQIESQQNETKQLLPMESLQQNLNVSTNSFLCWIMFARDEILKPSNDYWIIIFTIMNIVFSK